MTLVFVILFGLMLLGVPVAFAILSSGMAYLATTGTSILVVAQRLIYGLNSFTLLAVPLFILVGNLMDFGGISKRLTDWAKSLLGWLPGGLGIVTVFSCAIFAALTGSGPATVAAIGSIMLPSMMKAGYSKETSAGLVAAAGALGPIIPPSIAMILYSFYTETPVAKLFLGGLVPGILIGIMQCGVNYVSYRKRGYDIPITRFSMIHFIKTFWKSLGALIMPLIILLGIVFGIVTPTESGVLAIAYGLIYGFFVSRKLKVGDLPKIIVDSAVTTAVVFMTISAAGVLANVLVRMQLQQEVLNFAVNTLGNPYLATLFLIIVFMILGCFLDPTILIAMFAGIVVSVGGAFGFDPIHYGVIMVIVMQIGAITPPVGTFLFIACGVAGLPLEKSVKPLMPYILVILAAIALMIFVPGIVTFLPGLMR